MKKFASIALSLNIKQFYIGGHSITDIAKAAKISTSTVRRRLKQFPEYSFGSLKEKL